MVSSLIRGKYVICEITGPNSAKVITDGAVFQRNGEIIEVGTYNNLRVQHPTEQVIGSLKQVVIPGLVNNHVHVGITPFQLGSPELYLEAGWLLTRMIGARKVDPYLSHLYGATQMIKSGTTTVQVLAYGLDPIDLNAAEMIIKAYEDSGMRVSYGTSISNKKHLLDATVDPDEAFLSRLPSELAKHFKPKITQENLSAEEYTANIQEVCEKYAGANRERIRIVIAPSNVHRCSDDLLLALKQTAVKYKIGIHIHLQETIYQKLYGLRTWGKTPLQHLHDLEFLGRDVTCAHGVWLTDEDIDLMASTGVSVCHLASSNLRLQSGIAPINRLIEKGVRVSLGTDEAGINDDLDMLQEMRLVLRLHRVPGIEKTPLTANQVLQMATVNSANNTSFGNRIGSIEPGKRADLVLINLQNMEEPYLDEEVPIIDAVIRRGKCTDVDTVIVDGDMILQNRQLTRIDSDNLIKELRQSLVEHNPSRWIERRELMKQLEPYLRNLYAGAIEGASPPHYYYNAES
ncbi:amidohydrolase family protein [Chloroflexota bacterium]